MSTSVMNQQVPLASMPAQEKTLGTVGQTAWQQEQLTKGTYDSDLYKRDLAYHTVLPQGQQFTALPVDTAKQTLPVGTQGFTQGGLVVGEQPVLLGEKTLETRQGSQGAVQQQQFSAQSGVIPLKPICIEQESVTFRPQPITIEQPPLMVQPEAICIPQPPIVIHPEPIVIPQAPLVFQPPAVALARQAVTFQPDEITLARPSYIVQPLVQYDMRGCARFSEQDFKQHVHIRLTNDQIMRQQYGENWRGNQFMTQSTNLSSQNVQMQNNPNLQSQNNPNLQSQSNASQSTGSVTKPAKFFSRDRNYDYGLPPSTGDKIKDALGVGNTGPQNPASLNTGNIQNQKAADGSNTY